MAFATTKNRQFDDRQIAAVIEKIFSFFPKISVIFYWK